MNGTAQPANSAPAAANGTLIDSTDLRGGTSGVDFVRVSGDVISENFSDLDTGWGDVVSGNFDAENDADADLMVELGFVRVRHGERRRCGLGARGRG